MKIKWDDQLGGYTVLDEKTRNAINDWTQSNNLGWGSEGSKLIQELVISGAQVMNISFAHSWQNHKSELNPETILAKIIEYKIRNLNKKGDD